LVFYSSVITMMHGPANIKYIHTYIHTYGHMQHYKIVTNIICTALAIIMVAISRLRNAFILSRME